MAMKPTMKLRWVIRSVIDEKLIHQEWIVISRDPVLVQILQQWWESDSIGESGEWRDISINNQDNDDKGGHYG